MLHDLGHGPFSHLWEGVVHEGSDKHCEKVLNIEKNFFLILKIFSGTHEQQSVVLIEQLMDVNDIKLDDSPDTHRFALKLINSLIAADQAAWKQLLAPSEMFLTEIVSNKFCNIDVDKCDYILRDGHHVKQFVVLKPFINFLQRARIVHDDSGTSHIGYHVDDFELIENLFYNRAYLHMNVYQHFQVAGTERMVRDVCVKADAGGVTIDGLPLTEVQRDLSAYLKLDDSVIDLIRASPIDNQQVRDAQDIIGELDGERLYTLVWESTDSPKVLMDALTKKFGPIFRDVHKVIPYAEVPPNVPLYNDAGQAVMMTSNLRLSFRSTMIFCVKHDSELVRNVKNFIDSLNNNNEV